MAFKYSNNASSTLTASITAAATSISIQTGDAGEFPTLAAGDKFALTLVDGTGALEVVWCTARAGGVLTVVRAQEGTTAKPFAANSRADLRLTAGALANFPQLDANGKIPLANSPISTAPVDNAPADADWLVGLKADGSAFFRSTWGSIKSTLSAMITAATNGVMNGRAYPRNSVGTNMTFQFSGQGGQPSWLWGTADGALVQVWNPANFNVNAVGGQTWAAIAATIESRADAWATARANSAVANRVVADRISAAGFVAGDINNPYMMHDGTTIEPLVSRRNIGLVIGANVMANPNIGMVSFMRRNSACSNGDVENGANLTYTDANGKSGGSPGGGSWRCLGSAGANIGTNWGRYS